MNAREKRQLEAARNMELDDCNIAAVGGSRCCPACGRCGGGHEADCLHVQGPERVKIRCSFCDKDRGACKRLISGPGNIYICDECVELCGEICRESEDDAPRQAEELRALRARVVELEAERDLMLPIYSARCAEEQRVAEHRARAQLDPLRVHGYQGAAVMGTALELPQCSVLTFANEADPRWFAHDANGRAVMICDGHELTPTADEVAACSPDLSARALAARIVHNGYSPSPNEVRRVAHALIEGALWPTGSAP